MKLSTLLHKTGVKKLLVAVGAALVVTGGVFAFATNSDAASCPTNDIMPCGAKNASDFVAKLKKNNPSDMDNIYADGRYDLPKAEYDNFARYAKKGVINPTTGNVTVDGVTVMKDAKSLGRNSKGSISSAVTINGKKYYETPIRLLTKYNNDAMVLFDAKGNVQTVVMNLCGNPMTNTEVNPKYNCDALNVTSVSRDTFKFSSTISAANGATVTKVVYDFGDGTTHTEKNPSTAVTHKYAKAGNYTAKVTAYVKTKFGRGEFAITVTANCKKSLTVKEAEKPSIDIVKTVGVTETEIGKPFNYTVKVTNTGNVTLKDAKVTDTPAAGSNIQLTSAGGVGTISGNTWTYTIPELKVGETKNFTLTAKVTKYAAGELVNKVCVDTPTIPGGPDDCDEVTVKTTPPVYTCDTLHATKISRNTFEFSTSASAAKGATLEKVVYDFGDGSAAVTRTNPSDKVTYAYPQPGNYTAKVTVYVNVVGEGSKVIQPAGACTAPLTVEEPPKPKVEIDKKVENVEHKVVGLDTVYTYQIAVSNKGNVALKNVKVSDTPVAGITLIQGSAGTVSGNTWTYTIPELKVGETKNFTLTAKVPTYKAGTLKNTVCVDAPEIPGDKDDCDDATVEVPAPAYTCETLTVNRLERTKLSFTATHKVENATYVRTVFIVRNAAGVEIHRATSTNGTHAYTQATAGNYTVEAQIVVTVNGVEKIATSNNCKQPFTVDKEPTVEVCDPSTGKIIRVPVSEKDKYEDKDSEKCKPVRVCDPTTGKVIYVPYKDKDQYAPVDSEKCKPVRVCDPTTGIEKDVPYKDKDNYLPVGSPECGMARVCDPSTGKIIDVPYKDKDNYAPEASEKCKDVMVCDPATGTEKNVPYKDKGSYLPVGSKECGMVKVCDPTSGKVIDVPYKDKDQYKDASDAACQPKPEVPKTPEEPEPELPAELPKTGFADTLQAIVGMGSLTAAGYYYITSRKQ